MASRSSYPPRTSALAMSSMCTGRRPTTRCAALVEGDSVCLTVTLVDGLVLARSAFHHSINYRSVVVFGPAHEVEDYDEKRFAAVGFCGPCRAGPAHRHPAPQRWRATGHEGRQGRHGGGVGKSPGRRAKDDPEDLALTEIWAGEMPFHIVAGEPLPDQTAPVTAPLPTYLTSYRRPGLGAGA